MKLISQIVAEKIGPDEIDNGIIFALKNEIMELDLGSVIFLTKECFYVKLWNSEGKEYHPNIDEWAENSPLDFNYFTKYSLGRNYFLYVRKGIDTQASL